ncbi:DMT family transporter [Actinopolymorpha rutila]|uniref:Drug/metabolite transporter (DMT)-like permease n=1 Tax=Actinopolymorpha rutila TaxID=446787 RepID=A0A852ZUE4_9ACTN|nr:DMT family transporter [Actinopolymorpha rutila]NYH92306.1 drug/metabolite transporter (DMT)-like permease [Actinopolymorpha rutila]
MVISAVLAAFAAASNAFASVLQRYEARTAPSTEAFRLALLRDLARRPLWWLGIAGVAAAAVFQGAALLTGPLALVQPIMMVELPFTLMLAAVVFHQSLGVRSMVAVVGITAGVVALLVSVDPSGGDTEVGVGRWLLAAPGIALVMAALIGLGRAVRGVARAAALGMATAVMFSLTAAFMKDATGRIPFGAAAFFTSWQLYATCVAGLFALFLLQNAYQAGTLVVTQPAVTVGDALVSLLLGVLLFEEELRLYGWWLVAALLGLGMIIFGAVELSRSPLVSGVVAPPDSAEARRSSSPGPAEQPAESADPEDPAGPPSAM